jgi:streptogramin lyase/PKD repeat protein
MPSVLALEGRTLLTAWPRLDTFAVPTVYSVPNQIVDGPDGDLWFNESTSNGDGSVGEIGRITPQGHVTEIRLPTPSGGGVPTLSAMSAGPDGNLWAIDSTNNTIDRIGEDGQVATFPIPSSQASGNTGSIVSGADGNLWFTTGFSSGLVGWTTIPLSDNARVPGAIDRITPEGVLTQFPLPVGGGVASSLAVGPDGIWFTDPFTGRVGEIDYSGHAVEYSGPVPYYDLGPSPLAVGPDGDAYYFAQSASSSFIVKVAPGGAMTPIAIPGSIGSNLLSGSDGIYFLDQSSSDESFALDRLNPDRTLSTISTNSALSTDSGLAFGPDGNLWFAQGFGDIDRLDLSATPEPEPGPTLVVGSPEPHDLGTNGDYARTLIAPVGEATTFDLAGVRHSAGVTVNSATVDWGDGSTPTAGALGPDPFGLLDTVFVGGQVSGSHTYAQAGSYTVTVTIDGTGPTGAAMTTSFVETATAVDPTASPQPPLVLQAGQSIAYQGPLAIFSTPTPHDASGSDFTATVDWGDGSAPTAGTVVGGYEQDEGPPPPSFEPFIGPVTLFEVSGDHTYATAGTFTVTVTLTDKFGHSSTESTSIQVKPGPLLITPTSPIIVTADPTPASSGPNQDFISLGTLTDYKGTLAGVTVNSATVDWGDGSAPTAASLSLSLGTIDASTGADVAVVDGIYGTHAYAKAGSYTVKITIDDKQGDSAEATTTIQVSAGTLAVEGFDAFDASLGSTAGEPIPANPLVTIVAPVSADPPSDFTAMINWGDGSTPTTGRVSQVASNEIQLQGGSLQVTGDHTYSAPGLYEVTVTVHGPDGSTAQATSIFQVSLDSAINSFNSFPSTPTSSFTAGVASAPTVLGNFDGSSPADFKATVDWGDGSPIQSATIQPDGPPQLGSSNFNVLGGHDYAKAGSYTVTLTVIGADGLPYVMTNQATVAAPIIVKVTPPTPVVAPPVPSVVIKPSAPTILPRCFPDFEPTIAKHPKPTLHHKVAPPKVVKPAIKNAEPPTKKAKAKPQAVHHVAKKPAHATPAKKQPAWPARLVKKAFTEADRARDSTEPFRGLVEDQVEDVLEPAGDLIRPALAGRPVAPFDDLLHAHRIDHQ